MGQKTLELKALCQKLGRRYVGSRGNPKAPIWLVGEAPGEEEERQGVPFVGSSGKELDRMLSEAGISIEDCYYTNPYKVRPPENDLGRINEVGIPTSIFMDQFFEELLEHKPSFICPLGGTALGILCSDTVQARDGEAKISKWRGSLLTSSRLTWPHYVIPNFHPAYILREWSDRSVSVFIFRRLKEELDYWRASGKHQPLPERQLLAEPSYDESREYLEECLNHDGPVSEDIELLARTVPICDAFSYSRDSACSVSLFDGDPKKLAILWKLIDKIHRTKVIVGQNYSTFDVNWMQACGFGGGISQLEDTLVMHHSLYPEMSHKLDFQAMQFTREPYWKDEGKGWNLREGMRKLKLYNCKDAAVTLEIFEKMSKEFLEKFLTSIGKVEFKRQVMDVSCGLEPKVVDMVKSLLEKEQIELLGEIQDEKQNIFTLLFTRLCAVQRQKNSTSTTNVSTKIASIQHTSNFSQEVNIQKNIGKTEVNNTSLEDILQESVKSVTRIEDSVGGFENIFDFYRFYAMPLARAFHDIDKKGILTDESLIHELRQEIHQELDDRCVSISTHLKGRPVAASAFRAEKVAEFLKIDKKQVLNLASVPQLKELLKNELKIKLKINRFSHKETTGEESLNDAFAQTGNPVLKDLLRIRELNKILSTYVDAKLSTGVFYSCYSVTGTVTGRRASRKNFLGFGSNGQNQPKHSDLGERFQGVFIARPGCIFVYCDQASAEEWPVQGIIADVSGDDSGIKALKDSLVTGISRHARLASQLFSLPLDRVNDKECLEYYIGKKTRHAGTYDMRENTMASQMAAEGFVVETKFCKMFLEKFHQVEPNIRKVYHKYVEDELCKKRFLRTPLGRERYFHGLRTYGDNGKIFREGYAYIPQSTVGDNNGLAILHCQTTHPGLVLIDGHDSCLIEVENTWNSVLAGVRLLEQAYRRVITFPNGFQIQIPVDFKIGFSVKGLKKCPGSLNETGLASIYQTLNQQQSLQQNITSGQLSQLLAQP